MAAETAHGGPYDGATLSPSAPTQFVWTDGRRCYRSKGEGRTLYRRVWNRHGDRILVYAAFKWVLCSCGVYHRRVGDTCTLCGAALK